MVVSAVTAGCGIVGDCAVQLTVASWLLGDDATGKASGTVPASECVLEATSTARLLVVVVGFDGGGVPEPAGTDSVQPTSTCCPDAPLITACGYASTRYEDPAASDSEATCVEVAPSVVAAAFDPYSFGSTGVQVTSPDWATDCIAPSVHGPAILNWT